MALATPALADRDWPRKVQQNQRVDTDMDSKVLGPLADIKDIELDF